MSTYQHKPGRGSLFPNDKRDSAQHPSHKGKLCLPSGELRWCSAWINDDGRISVSVGDIVQPKGDGAAPAPGFDWKKAEAAADAEPRVSMEEAAKILKAAAEDPNDDIPF